MIEMRDKDYSIVHVMVRDNPELVDTPRSPVLHDYTSGSNYRYSGENNHPSLSKVEMFSSWKLIHFGMQAEIAFFYCNFCTLDRDYKS